MEKLFHTITFYMVTDKLEKGKEIFVLILPANPIGLDNEVEIPLLSMPDDVLSLQ